MGSTSRRGDGGRLGGTALTAWVALGVVACAVPSGVEPREEAVVYGPDDRVEAFAHPSALYRALAADAVVALIPRNLLLEEGGGFRLDPGVRTLAQSVEGRFDAPACDDLRFSEQPIAAFCSGTLIDSQLVMTAGHCVPDGVCATHRFVFDYRYAARGALETIDRDDVYECAEVLAHRVDSKGADFAIIRLDRPVVARLPAQVDDVYSVVDGARVTAIGAPSGVPIKIDDGGVVQWTRAGSRDYFVATPDAFGGSSGSGIFDLDGVLVGILVRGQNDFDVVRSGSGSCVTAATRPANTSAAESIAYAAGALRALCDARASEALCAGLGPLAPPGEDEGQHAQAGASGCGLGRQGPSGLPAWTALLLAPLALAVCRRRRPPR